MENIINLFGLAETPVDYEWLLYLVKYTVMILILGEIFSWLKYLLVDVFMRRW